jgi:L-alanine-DL-glutamate epimerase-like enolase superfamily enzyme
LAGLFALKDGSFLTKTRATFIVRFDIIYNAISGIEAALWDVLGQSLGVPIHRLLGERFRDKVSIYADCHGARPLSASTRYGVPARRGGCRKTVRTFAMEYFGHAGKETTSSPADYRRRALEKKGGRIHRLEV